MEDNNKKIALITIYIWQSIESLIISGAFNNNVQFFKSILLVLRLGHNLKWGLAAMKNEIKEISLRLVCDICGVANIDRFNDAPKGFHPRDIYGECNSVIVFANDLYV